MSNGSLTPAKWEYDLQRAREQGFEIVLGNERLLLLDLDLDGQEPRLEDTAKEWELIQREFGASKCASWRSKSGNWHVSIDIGPALTPPERIALQLALGSDPIKELLALVCHRNGVAEPVVLFKPPQPKVAPPENDDIPC